MSEQKNLGLWILVGGTGLLCALIGAWLLSEPAPTPLAPAAPEPVAESTPETPAERVPEPQRLPISPAADAYTIAEHGRIAISADTFPSDGPVHLDLGLPDEARGSGPRPVRVASVDGRQIKTTASPHGPSGGGIRLDLDPAWLIPGRYLIEVSTAEKSHIAVRRYVLEVR